MGDRTWASVSMREEYYAVLKEEIDELNYVSEVDFDYSVVRLIQEEANYGEMEPVTELLDKHKVPYDHSWESGGTYAAGTNHVRWDEKGEPHQVDYATDYKDMIDIHKVLQWIDEGLSPKLLALQLQEVLQSFRPWNNQTDLAEIPLRELTPEESAKIMEYKMNKEE